MIVVRSAWEVGSIVPSSKMEESRAVDGLGRLSPFCLQGYSVLAVWKVELGSLERRPLGMSDCARRQSVARTEYYL